MSLDTYNEPQLDDPPRDADAFDRDLQALMGSMLLDNPTTDPVRVTSLSPRAASVEGDGGGVGGAVLRKVAGSGPARVWLKLLGLVLVLALAGSAVFAIERADIEVDGATLGVQAFSATVASALDEAGVELDTGDEVSPSLDTVVTDGMVISVTRADDYTVILDGQPAIVSTVAATVEDVLAAMGIELVPGAQVTPAAEASVAAGQRIVVDLPSDYTVIIDGEQHFVSMVADDAKSVVAAAGLGDVSEAVIRVADGSVANGGRIVVRTPSDWVVKVDGTTLEGSDVVRTVRDVIAAAEVELGPRDRVRPRLRKAVDDGQVIRVTRVAVTTSTVDIAIDNETVVRETSDRYEGDEVVVTEGSDGLRTETWKITTENGVEVDRELVSRDLVSEPVTRVVEVGTAARPAPEPEPAAPSTPTAPSGSVWDRLAACESGGNWSLNVGTYDGGLQFHPSTWSAWKLSSYPEYAWQASRTQQIEAATRLQAALGWGQWPACSAKLGLR